MNIEAIVEKLTKETFSDLIAWFSIEDFEYSHKDPELLLPPLLFNEFRYLNSDMAYIGFRPGYVFLLLDETFTSGKNGKTSSEKNLYISQGLLNEFYSISLSNVNAEALAEAIKRRIDFKTPVESVFNSYLKSK